MKNNQTKLVITPDMIDKDRLVHQFILWLENNKNNFFPLAGGWEKSIQVKTNWIEFYWFEKIDTGKTCHTRMLPLTDEGKKLLKGLPEQIYIPFDKILKIGINYPLNNDTIKKVGAKQ